MGINFAGTNFHEFRELWLPAEIDPMKVDFQKERNIRSFVYI